MTTSFAYEKPEDSLARGNAQWAIAWRRFSDQQAQPRWIKLCVATFGSSSFHSSQIGGWIKGKLKSPAPKLLLVTGLLNLGIAYSNSSNEAERAALFARGARQLPESHRSSWQHIDPIRLPDGTVLGPDEVFQALTGRLDLGVLDSRHIPLENEAQVAKALGRHLRRTLTTNDVDWLTELPGLREVSPEIEPLLMGQPIKGDAIVAALPTIATAANLDAEALWDVCTAAMKNNDA
jgi:hypothetical protein